MCTCEQCAHIAAHVWIHIFNTHMLTTTDRWDLHAPDLINQWAAVTLLFGGVGRKKKEKVGAQESPSRSHSIFSQPVTSGTPESEHWELQDEDWRPAWPVEEGQSQPNRLSRHHLKLTEGKKQREGEKGGKKNGWKEGRKERGRERGGSWQWAQWWLPLLACRSHGFTPLDCEVEKTERNPGALGWSLKVRRSLKVEQTWPLFWFDVAIIIF